MAAVRTVATQGRTYTVADATALRWAALAVARIGGTDPVTGVRAVTPRTAAHVVTGGWLVITGDPSVVLPDLGASAYELTVEVTTTAARRLVTIAVPAGSVLPVTGASQEFAATHLAVTGIVTAATFPGNPVAGAEVDLTATHPAGTATAVRTDLALAHDEGITVRSRSTSPSTVRTLAAAAVAGDTALLLDATTGVAAGALLDLGDGELVTVATTDVATARVALRVPVRRSRPAGSQARVTVLGAVSATSTLARPVVPGDGLVVLAAGAVGPVVELVDGTDGEFRRIGAITGADGRYRIAGLRGVAAVSVTISAAGFSTLGPRLHSFAPHVDPLLIDARLTV